MPDNERGLRILKNVSQSLTSAQLALSGILEESGVKEKTVEEVLQDDSELGMILTIALALYSIQEDLSGLRFRWERIEAQEGREPA